MKQTRRFAGVYCELRNALFAHWPYISHSILSCYHNEWKLHNMTLWPDITSHDPHDLTDWSSNISTGTDIRPHSSLQWQPCVHLDDITLASVSPEAEPGSSWDNIPLPWHWHMALHCRHVQYVDIRSDQSQKYRRHVCHVAAMTAVMICPWQDDIV